MKRNKTILAILVLTVYVNSVSLMNPEKIVDSPKIGNS